MNIKQIRKQVLDGFLYNLYIISDKSYQKRIWIEEKGPEVHCFEEAVCDFFDLGEYIFNNYKGYNITEKQKKLLNNFQNKFKIFVDKNDFPKEFIDTPEWASIMEQAKEVLEAFHYQKE